MAPNFIASWRADPLEERILPRGLLLRAVWAGAAPRFGPACCGRCLGAPPADGAIISAITAANRIDTIAEAKARGTRNGMEPVFIRSSPRMSADYATLPDREQGARRHERPLPGPVHLR